MKRNFRAFLLQAFASFLTAFAIWLIAKQNDTDSTWVTASVQLRNVAPNVSATAEPDKIKLNVQYPRELNNSILSKNFQLAISVRELFSGDPHAWPNPGQPVQKDYKLVPAELQSLLSLGSAQVLMTDPPMVSLTGRLMVKPLEIDVRTSNALPDKLALTGPLRAEPPRVLVTGTREALERAGHATTTPIDLSQVSASMQAFPQLVLPGGVQLVSDNAPITVNIGISERAVRQTISSVPINYLSFSGLATRVTPPTADVVIEGPASAVGAIGPDDISFTPARDLPEVAGKRYDVAIEAHLKASVAPEVASQITIRECHPAGIKVEFVAPTTQNKPSPRL